MRARSAIALIGLFFAFASYSLAQTPCPAPPLIHGTAKGNIFTEAQEMDLGDAIAQQFERNFHVMQDPQLNAYLNEIARKLLAQMPPTQLKIQVTLVDLPVVNAFTIPGGRIYITRKFVAFAQSEDELAAVLSHELGHALSHQPAARFSQLFRQILGVSQVGDRDDVFRKYNLVLDSIARKHLHFDVQENEEDQDVADKYGVYALTRAGYSPEAMADMWDRYAHTQGKTGNWLTDLFGTTGPGELRLRRMRESVPPMPAACIAPHVETAAAFRAWQQSVIAYTTSAESESLAGLVWKRQLSPPLESEITNVKFSPDGKYILAQDDFSVYILSRQPLRALFRIPVDGIESASFTPDSQSVLIWTHGLHVEKWNVGLQKRTEVHEVVVPRPCTQTTVSSDGSVAACVQMVLGSDEMHFDFSLIDTATNASILMKQHLYSPSHNELFAMLFLFGLNGQTKYFNMAFSPDGHYFAISGFLVAWAWDVQARTPLKLSSTVQNIMSDGFAFDAPDDIVGINARDPKKSGSAHFPSGAAGISIPFYHQTFEAPAAGGGILVRPAGNNAVALVDLKTGKGLLGSQVSALDVYGQFYARPRPDGAIGLYDLTSRQEIASTPLLGHWIGNPLAAEVSPDLKWFAASGKTRGAIWNLATGERVFHVRGFSACAFSSQDDLFADFIPFEKVKRSLEVLNPADSTVKPGVTLDDDKAQISQVGMYLLHGQHEHGKWNGPLDLEVQDISTGTALWQRRFTNGFPNVHKSPESDWLSMVLPLNSDETKQQQKEDPALAEELKRISNKDSGRLVQIVNAEDGKLEAEVAVDTGNGSFRIQQALPAGKWVVLADNENRALVYSIDGKLVGTLFGTRPTVSGSAGFLALESQARTLAIYDLATLTKREDLTFSSPVVFYQFVDNGSKLFAATDDQTAYMLAIGR